MVTASLLVEDAPQRREAAPTSGRQAPDRTSRLPHLDVLRFVAIALVIGRHAQIETTPLTWGRTIFDTWKALGWLGVDLFFTLSGFLIGGLLFAELAERGRLDVRRFLIRRGLKIWPSYAVFLIVAVVTVGLPPLIASDPWVSFSRVSAFWPAFLHVQNYVRIEPRRATLDVTHLWSLSVEEHFYLALPLLLLALSRRRIFHISPLRVIAIASAVVFAGCLASRIYVSLSSAAFAKFELYTPTHMRMDSLMAGVLLAAIVAFRRPSFERLRPWAWALLVTGMLCYVPYLVVNRSSFFGHTFGYSLLWIGSSLMVIWAWLRSTDAAAASVPRGRLLAWAAVIGSYSYSIYLWHLPFGRMLTGQIVKGVDVTAPYAYAIYMMVYVLVSIAVGIVSYKLIEGPVLAWRDRVMPR